MKNKYCDLNALRNESDVEQFFVIKLIEDLGFKQDNIYTKKSLKTYEFGKGQKKARFVPDYQLNDGKMPLVIIEAKGPGEIIEDYIHEAQEYAMVVNRNYIGNNPIKFCITTNGVCTYINKPDENNAVLKINFSDFTDDNKKYLLFRQTLLFSELKKNIIPSKSFEFITPEIDNLRGILCAAHNNIRSKEKVGPKKAFYEFSKLLFIKMNEDKNIEEKINNGDSVTLDDFAFSTEYIDKQSKFNLNPINTLFEKYRDELESLVNKGEKKRIFRKDETLQLKPNTIRSVVELIQNFNLKSVEDDLNGKVFETFLESSVRGKELGQFFTPRSVVKFMSTEQTECFSAGYA